MTKTTGTAKGKAQVKRVGKPRVTVHSPVADREAIGGQDGGKVTEEVTEEAQEVTAIAATDQAPENTQEDKAAQIVTGPLTFRVKAADINPIPVPGLDGAKVLNCFARVTEIPESLDNWMETNPRVPNRTQKGILSGPVIKGIMSTLLNDPTMMGLKNQGIYLSVESVNHYKGDIVIHLTDRSIHGIVNGGHTYAAIRDAIETTGEEAARSLERAYVPLHILTGIPAGVMADIAEGLNRNKQVDDSSLANLQGRFRPIQEAMVGEPGARSIAYHQGAQGEVDISDVLVFLEMFNQERFDQTKHPSYLYSRVKSAQEFYLKDLDAKPSPITLLVPHLPEILRLSDLIRRETPAAAKRQGFEFGRMKTGKTAKRAKSTQQVALPFLGESMSYRVPDGWLYPMLASFRANVKWDLARGKFQWLVPLNDLVPKVIDRLVGVCISEHKFGGQKPDRVGKADSAYSQCYDKVQLYLLGADKVLAAGATAQEAA